MAMFVERMLGKTTAGPGGANSLAAYAGKVLSATLTYNYADIDAGAVTYEGHNAIAEIYHLGIPGHAKTNTAFSPTADITRADMATWMTNALAHTNARPAGVWVQVTGAASNTAFGTSAVTLHISHRDSARAAVPGTLIDVFTDKTAANTDPFSATTGLCTANVVEKGNAGTACAIDLGDVSTDVFGNVAQVIAGANPSGGVAGGNVAATETWTWYAHTGAVGTKYNNLTAPGNTVSRSQSTAAGALVITSTVPTYNVDDSSDAGFDLVKYGTSHTITGTLKTSATGTVVPAAVAVKIVESVWSLADDGAGIDNDGDAETLLSTVTTSTATDASGVVTHTITQADPSAATTNLNRTHTSTVITWDNSGNGVADQAATDASVDMAWDDNPSLGNTTTMTEGTYSAIGLTLAQGGVARTHTAKVHDQYGNGLANQVVTFTSDSKTGTADVAEAFTQSSTRTTDTTGVATLAYTDVSAATLTGKVVTTASPATGNDATSTFYRLDGTTANHTETDATNADGGPCGTNTSTEWVAATTDIFTFNANHLLNTGDACIVTVIAANVVGIAAGDTEYFFEKIDATTGKFYTTRSVSALGVSSLSGLVDITTAGTGSNGRMEKGDADSQAVAAGDEYMEVVIHDNANNAIVVEQQSAIGDYDYMRYTYDSGDQFNVYADGTGSNSLTPVSLATFELHLAAKMNALTGAPGVGFAGDIVSITYTNGNAGGGVSVFNLGS
jgi:hypothetical protein